MYTFTVITYQRKMGFGESMMRKKVEVVKEYIIERILKAQATSYIL